MLALAVLSTRPYSHTQYPKPTRSLSSEPYIIVTINWNDLTETEATKKPGTSLPFHDKLTAREPKRSEFIAKSQAARQAVKFRALIPAEPHFIIPKVTFGTECTTHNAPQTSPKRPPKPPSSLAPTFTTRFSFRDILTNSTLSSFQQTPFAIGAHETRSLVRATTPPIPTQNTHRNPTMLSNGAAAPHVRNGSVSGGPPAEIPPYRHMSSGSLNIPTGLGQQPNGNGQPQAAGAMAPGGRFEGPRSPPGKQSRSSWSPRKRWLGVLMRFCRYIACALQVLPPRRVPGGEGVSIQSRPLEHYG